MARLRTLLLLLLLGSGARMLLSPGFMRDPVRGRRTLGLVNPSEAEEVRQGREMAPALVAAHGGTIEAGNDPTGGGASVSFTLPT